MVDDNLAETVFLVAGVLCAIEEIDAGIRTIHAAVAMLATLCAIAELIIAAKLIVRNCATGPWLV